jgi:hypothetical protein
MASKRKRRRKVETVDELQARVAAKLARQVEGVASMVDEGRDIVRRGVLEAIDDFLGETDE